MSDMRKTGRRQYLQGREKRPRRSKQEQLIFEKRVKIAFAAIIIAIVVILAIAVYQLSTRHVWRWKAEYISSDGSRFVGNGSATVSNGDYIPECPPTYNGRVLDPATCVMKRAD
jgi:hypothetical protein